MRGCAYLAKQAPNPSNVLGVFGLSIRTTERDLDDEFSRYGRVEKVVIVYDQRVSRLWRFSCIWRLSNLDGQSDRSRGFGFITMSTTDEAGRCIKELNGVVCEHQIRLPLKMNPFSGPQRPSYPSRLLRDGPPSCSYPW